MNEMIERIVKRFEFLMATREASFAGAPLWAKMLVRALVEDIEGAYLGEDAPGGFRRAEEAMERALQALCGLHLSGSQVCRLLELGERLRAAALSCQR